MMRAVWALLLCCCVTQGQPTEALRTCCDPHLPPQHQPAWPFFLQMRWHARGAQVALDVSRGVAFMHSQGVVWAGEGCQQGDADQGLRLARLMCCGPQIHGHAKRGPSLHVCPPAAEAAVASLFPTPASTLSHASPPPLACPSTAILPQPDCKPGNVLLTDSWRAKVTDLGTSRLLRGHSTAQSSATPAYAGEVSPSVCNEVAGRMACRLEECMGVNLPAAKLHIKHTGSEQPPASRRHPHTVTPLPPPLPLPAAPEQLLNGRVGLPSDVFSLGLLLHDLCTGEQPALAVGGEGRACYRRPLAHGGVRGRGM